MRGLISMAMLALAGCGDAEARGNNLGLITLPMPGPLTYVASIGDSITQGNFALTYYPQGMRANNGLAVNYETQNFGAPGVSAQNMWNSPYEDAQDYVANVGRFQYASVLGGINDLNLNGASAVQIEGYLQTIYDGLVAATPTIKVVAFTIMPFHSASSWTQAKDTVRTTVNSWINTYCTVTLGSSKCCLSDSASYMSNAPTDSTYLLPSYEYNAQTDGIHVDQAGQDRLGAGLKSCLP